MKAMFFVIQKQIKDCNIPDNGKPKTNTTQTAEFDFDLLLLGPKSRSFSNTGSLACRQPWITGWLFERGPSDKQAASARGHTWLSRAKQSDLKMATLNNGAACWRAIACDQLATVL